MTYEFQFLPGFRHGRHGERTHVVQASYQPEREVGRGKIGGEADRRGQ